MTNVKMNKKKRKIVTEAKDGDQLHPKSKKTKTEEEVPENNQDSETEIPVKEEALNFDVKHFRKQLDIPTNKSASLNQFLHVCTKSTVDYISEYLKAGGTAGEILKQLDDQKNVHLANTVFDIYRLILTKIQSSMGNLLQSAEDTCRYFLNSFVPIMEIMLSEKSTTKQQKSILKLLTSIVVLNSELGLTVLNQLSLKSKALTHLVRHGSGKDKNDVRAVFIDFIMAFLVENNITLIKAVLEKQGLVAMIIPDLVKDDASTIQKVLNLLLKSLIFNMNVSKTMKIRTFTQYVISTIFNIFNWKGTKSNKGDDITETKTEIDVIVDHFLFTLCTSHKYGIYFVDKSLGAGDVPTNQYLYKAIESLEAPWNNEKAGSLLIGIIKSCPDLYKPVKQIIEDSFNPRDSEQWYKCSAFFKTILLEMPTDKIIDLATESPRQVLMFIKNTYLPAAMLKTTMDIFKTKNYTMIHEAILLLQTILERIKNYLKLLDSGFSNIKTNLLNIVQVFIPKFFPSVDSLIVHIHNILDMITVDDENQNIENSSLSISDYLVNILNLLLLYNDIIPNLIDPVSAMLDSRRIFKKIEFIKDNVTELKLKTTMFLICADKFAFSPTKPLFSEILSAMFEVYVSGNVNMVNEAKGVLYNILDTTEIFEKNRLEIELLLYTTQEISKKNNETAGNMIVEVIENIVRKLNEYSQQLLNYSTKDIENTETIDNYEVIFKNIENYNKNRKVVNFIHETVELTPFLIGLLELSNDIGKKYDCIHEFSNQFMVNLLHCQEKPEILWSILENYSKINVDVKNYINGWKSNPISISKNIFYKDSLLLKLSKSLLKDSIIDITSVFNSQESFSTIQIKIYMKMILFYTFRQNIHGTLNDTRLSNVIVIIKYLLGKCLEQENFKDYVTLVGQSLGNNLLHQDFDPFKKNNKHIFLTDYVFKIITLCNENSIEMKSIESIIKPYKHKIFLSLLSEIEISKAKKSGFINEDITYIFSIMKLNLNDAVILLGEILQLESSCMATTTNEPSSWIDIISYILQQCSDKDVQLSRNVFNNICILYSKLIKDFDFVMNISGFEESIYNYLLLNLNLIESVRQSLFDELFITKHFSKHTSKLGILLLQLNPNLLTKFNKNIVKEEILSKREFVLPLTGVAFGHAKFKNFKDVRETVYKFYKANILKIVDKPQKATQIYIDNIFAVNKLIYHCMDIEECKQFSKKTHKFDVCESFHLDILETIFLKSFIDNDKLNVEYLDSFLITVFQLSIILLKRDELQYEKTSKISSLLSKIVSYLKNREEQIDLKNVIISSAWQNFYKHALMSFLKPISADCCLFGNVSDLIMFMYPDDHSGIVELFSMLTSHSEFLNMMLSNQYPDVKTHLVSLIYALVNKNKSVMKVTHIPFYLSAYQATISKKDKTILRLLKYYESNGFSMNEYKPYLWGDVGANHYALKSSRKKSSLWSNPSVNHVLNLLDKEKIETTIKYFPIKAELNEMIFKSDENIYNVIDTMVTRYPLNFDMLKSKSDRNTAEYVDLKLKLNQYKNAIEKLDIECLNLPSNENLDDVYDPSFILPLLSYIVAPGSSVSCHRILRGGILAIPLMALSSYCPMMRAAAYNVLYRFFTLLEAEMYYKNDKLLWTQFLNSLRASLDTAINPDEQDDPQTSPRLPAISALYLARAALVMTSPLDPLFKPINHFVISKQHINLTVIPDFLDLFHNPDITYMERRIWILKVLRDGLKSFSDVKLLSKSVAFKILFDFYSCSLSDIKTKLIIIEVINNIVCIPKAAFILAESYGLFPWLSFTIRSLTLENKNLISAIIKLIYNLLINLMVNKTTKISTKDIQESIGKCFRLSDSSQSHILCLLMDFMKKLSGVPVSDMKLYLNSFRKISSEHLKLVNKTQVINLVNDCQRIADKNNRYCKNILLGIENKKSSMLSNLKILLDNSNDCTDEIIVIQYLLEVVTNWL